MALAALVATFAVVTFGLRAEGAAASTPCIPAADLISVDLANASCFEGFDGNQVSNHPALLQPHVDWQNLVGQSSLITVRDDTGDSTFSGGDKENDPGGWAINAAGGAQDKVDVLAAATQTDRVAGDTFVYGAFERLAATGDVFLSFEFNQIPTLFNHDNNAATAPIPERSEGDALITFTGNQGNIDVYMCRWHGDGLGETSDASYGWYELPGFGQPDPNGPGLTDKATGSDGCTLLDTAGSPAAAGEMNNGAIDNYLPRFGSPTPLPANGAGAPNTIADEEFGEMVINLDTAIQRGGAANPCFAFGAVWVHTRASHSFTSGMEDLTTTTQIPGTGSCAIGIDKTVSVNQDPNTVPADGTFADTAFAETGDTLHYKFAVTNQGTEPITGVTVTDPLCSSAPVRTAGDDGDNILEVGETWIYRCTRTYAAGDANTFVNTGTAKGQVGPGVCPAPANSTTLKCLEDTDTATITRVTKLTITKDTVPNALQDFAFETGGTGLAGFSLDDDSGVGGADNTLSNTKTFTNPGAGDKYVREAPAVAGYSIGSITCTGDTAGVVIGRGGTTGGTFVNGGSDGFDAGDDTVKVPLDLADQVSCTFVNEKDTTVTIIKDADPSDAQDFAFTTTGTGLSDFSLDDDADNALPNQRQFTISGRSFGTKTVTEGATSGWALTNIACTGDANAVEDEANRKATLDVDPGETIVCTFNNRKDASVTITKQYEPSTDDGRFDLKVDQTVVKANAADGESGTRGGLAPGTYAVSEVVGSVSPAGRALSDYVTGIECSGESAAQGSHGTVTLVAGENATCTITNTRKASIKVTKDLVTDTDDGRFDLKVDGDVIADEAGDGGSGSKGGLVPGSYTVSEVMGSTAPAGRTLNNYDTTIACTGEDGVPAGTSRQVTVSAGENVECVITNTRIRVAEDPVIDTTRQCLRRPLLAWVRSKPRNKPTLIRKVTFYLDGKVVGVDRKPDKQNRFTTLIQRRELTDGPHKLRAKIVFFGSRKGYWLGLRLKRCLNQAVPQEITTTAPSNGRCPANPFLAYVKSSIISSVTYTLNGKRLRTLRVANWRKRYAVKIDPSQLGSGENVLKARIRFITGTKKGAVTLTEVLPSCGSTLATNTL